MGESGKSNTHAKATTVGFWAIHADNKILQDSLRVNKSIPVVEDVIVSSIAVVVLYKIVRKIA